MDQETIKLIRASSLFRDVSDSGFQQVLENGILRSVEGDGYFFMQRDPATHAYVLVSGRVKMVQITASGQQIPHCV